MAYGTDKLKIIDELMCNMKYIVTWRTPLTIFFTVKTSNYIHGETRTSVALLLCVNSTRVLFFILGFWLRFNSNLTSKSGLLCKQVRLYSLFKEKPQKVDFKVAFKRIRYTILLGLVLQFLRKKIRIGSILCHMFAEKYTILFKDFSNTKNNLLT